MVGLGPHGWNVDIFAETEKIIPKKKVWIDIGDFHRYTKK